MLRLLIVAMLIVACSKRSNEVVNETKDNLPQNISLYPFDATECNAVARELLQLPDMKKANVKYRSLGKYKVCYTETELNEFKMNYRLYLLDKGGDKLIFSSMPGTGVCGSHGILVKYTLAKNEITTASSSHVIVVENALEKECKGTFQDMVSNSDLHIYDLAQGGKKVFTHKLVDEDGHFLKANSLFDFEDRSGVKYKLELSGNKYIITKK
jgi:hypothetical protein